MLRIKELHDTVNDWNKTLEQRVAEQVGEIERMSAGSSASSRRRSPSWCCRSGDEKLLESHRRDISVVFCDLRGFTAFAETAEPEEVMGVLREYHACLGALIHKLRGHAGAASPATA